MHVTCKHAIGFHSSLKINILVLSNDDAILEECKLAFEQGCLIFPSRKFLSYAQSIISLSVENYSSSEFVQYTSCPFIVRKHMAIQICRLKGTSDFHLNLGFCVTGFHDLQLPNQNGTRHCHLPQVWGFQLSLSHSNYPFDTPPKKN